MARKRHPRIVSLCIRLIDVASHIVPRKWRSLWQQEWQAEILYVWEKLGNWNRATWRKQMKLFKRTLGAITDAAWMRQQFTFNLDFMQDVRFGLRQLRKNPGFTVVAVLTLALGIGANTAIFSLIQGVLLTPLPYEEPDRLVRVWEKNYVRGRDRNVVNPGNFMRWRERNQVFEEMAVLGRFNGNLTGDGDPQRIPFGFGTPNLFSLLGQEPLLGRNFRSGDGEDGAENVVILSHRLWQRRYGGDDSVLGKKLILSGDPHTVIGVMPPKFSFPDDCDLWYPITLQQRHYDSKGRSLTTVARLKPNVTIEQARVEMENLGLQLEKERPEFNSGWTVTVYPLHEDIVSDFSLALWVLMGAVGFVLLIACANLANLLLARATKREKEFSIRTALGAGRLRLLRQLLTESALLALAGGALGILVAKVALDGLMLMTPTDIPSYMNISLDWVVLGFAAAISLFAGLLFGTVPAWRSSRPNFQNVLRESGRSSGGGGALTFRNALIVAQVALSLILLVGAGLLVKSFLRLANIDPGYDTAQLVNFQVSMSGAKYPDSASRNLFLYQALDSLGAVPGVRSTGAISWQPLGGIFAGTSFVPKDRPEIPSADQPVATVAVVAGDLFQTMRIPLVQGRLFDSQDSEQNHKVVIINESMAREFWLDGDAVGKLISMSWGEWIDAEVIGVVGDARLANLDTAARATLYWHQPQLPYNFMTIVARTESDPAAVIPEFRTRIADLDSDMPLTGIRTMDAVAAQSLEQPRFTVFLLGIFSSLALVLALIGIYGVISYAVGQRTHEIGIRIAMGASRGTILRMILGRGLILLTVGATIGLTGAFALSRYVESLLFQTDPTDALTYTAVTAVMLITAVLASYIPARRAAKVDPMVALRYE